MSQGAGLFGRLLLLGLLAGAALSLGNGSRGLFEPSEGRYGSIAAEMVRSGDLVVPRFNGRPHLEKPPLSLWAMAGAMSVLGIDEGAVRLPSVLGGVLAALVAFLLAAESRSSADARDARRRGWVAAALVLAAPLLFATARTATTDAVLTGTVALALLFAARAVDDRRGPRARARYLTAAMLASALGFLTKGPVVLLFTLLPVLLEALWSRRPRELRALFHPGRLLLFAAVVVPWFLVLEQRLPGSLEWLLTKRAVGAAVSSKSFHPGPWYYFVPVFLLGFLPAGALLLSGGRRVLGELLRERRLRLLFLAVLPPFVVLSLSASKLVTYPLPMLVAVAVLATEVLARGRGRRTLVGAGALVGVVVLAALGAGTYYGVGAVVGNAGRALFALAAVLGLLAAVLSYRLARRERLLPAALALAGLQLGALAAAVPAGSIADAYLSRDGTGRDVARAIAELGPTHPPVVCYRNLIRGLPFYLGGELSVLRVRATDHHTGTAEEERFLDLRSTLDAGPRLIVCRTRHVETLRSEAGPLATLWAGKKLTLLSNAGGDSDEQP